MRIRLRFHWCRCTPRDFADNLKFFNYERAHDDRYTKGSTPSEVVYGAPEMRPR